MILFVAVSTAIRHPSQFLLPTLKRISYTLLTIQHEDPSLQIESEEKRGGLFHGAPSAHMRVKTKVELEYISLLIVQIYCLPPAHAYEIYN